MIVEQTMPDKASYKSKGGDKDSATKNTFNPSPGKGPERDPEAKGPDEQDIKHRSGQYTGAGNPPIMKK